MKINRAWMAAGLTGAAHLARQCKKNAFELIQLQAAMVYLKGIEMVRDLLLYQIGILICVIFLIFGVILMEAGLVFYFPMEFKTRVTVLFGVGAFDCLTALALLGYFASSGHWLKQAARYNECLEGLLEEDRLQGNGRLRARRARAR